MLKLAKFVEDTIYRIWPSPLYNKSKSDFAKQRIVSWFYLLVLKNEVMFPNPTFTVSPGLYLRKGFTFSNTLGHVDFKAQDEKFRQDSDRRLNRAIKYFESLERKTNDFDT